MADHLARTVSSNVFGSNPLLASRRGVLVSWYLLMMWSWYSQGSADRLLSQRIGRGVKSSISVKPRPSRAGTTQNQHPTGQPLLAKVADALWRFTVSGMSPPTSAIPWNIRFRVNTPGPPTLTL